jgi:aerobic-type carbon monoxide dehydrogenase small subunit (CoxS/CutS family)
MDAVGPERSMSEDSIQIKVNGERRPVARSPERSLLAVLRNELGLTGAKYGCGEGECGACTVLLAGAPSLACQVSVLEVGEREVVTVEGLEVDGQLNAVQRAFAELGAFQCGFCTPGMVVRATALLEESPSPSPAETRAAMQRNLCRCGGYAGILRAIERASELHRTAPRRRT